MLESATRSSKIMRRILRKIGEGDTSHLGDTSTLADPTVVDSLVKGKQGLRVREWVNLHDFRSAGAYR